MPTSGTQQLKQGFSEKFYELMRLNGFEALGCMLSMGWIYTVWGKYKHKAIVKLKKTPHMLFVHLTSRHLNIALRAILKNDKL